VKTHSICNETKNKQDLMDQLHILLMQSSLDKSTSSCSGSCPESVPCGWRC